MRYLLERAALIHILSSEAKSTKYLAKPDKIYMNNTNLMYALTIGNNAGTIREVFFNNQLAAAGNELNYPKQGDFLVNHKQLFEIGGKNKTFDQIKDIPDSYLAIGDIETGHGNRIPLWLFGFLY